MKIAILGASGQLGQRTLADVLERGHDVGDVVAAARTPHRLQVWEDKGIVVRRGDYTAAVLTGPVRSGFSAGFHNGGRTQENAHAYEDEASLRAAFGRVDHVLLIPSTAPPPQRVQQVIRVFRNGPTSSSRSLLLPLRERLFSRVWPRS